MRFGRGAWAAVVCSFALAEVPHGRAAPAEAPAAAAQVSFDELLRDKLWEEAEAHARARLAADPSDHEAGVDLARVVLRSKQRERYDEAIAALEAAMEKHPDRAEYHFLVGQLYGEQARAAGVGGLSLARKCKSAFMRAVELEPANFEYVYALNEYLLEAPFIAGGSAGRARKIAREFGRKDPDAGAMLMARAHIVGGEYDKAFDILRQLERRDEMLYNVSRRMLVSEAAIGLIEEGEAEKTLQILEDLVLEFPNNALVNLAVGRARLETGDITGAVQALSHSLATSRRLETLYHLALAEKAAGNLDAARELLTEAAAAAKGSMAKEIERQLAGLEG